MQNKKKLLPAISILAITVVFFSLVSNTIVLAATPAVAVNDSYTTVKNTALNVSAPGVLANDTDADGDPLTAVKVTDPDHGTVIINADGSFIYTPWSNYFGTDSFTYKANDGLADSNAARVSITIAESNHPPEAFDDSYATIEDKALDVSAFGVLVNDTDTDDADALTAVKVTNPVHGSLTLNTDGSFRYIPTADYNGTDSFTYKANDGKADSDIVMVNITVSAVNDEPGFTKGKNQTVLENSGQQTVTNWAISISAGPPDESGQALNFVIDDNSNPDLFSVAPAVSPTGTLTYTPAANKNGSAEISVSLHDDQGTANGGLDASPSKTFTITVTGTGVANISPTAGDDSYTTNENAILDIAASGVLANDTDADGDPLTAVKVTDPVHGSLTLNADGSFSYTPATDYNGADSFTYQANDGKSDSGIAMVSIMINTLTQTTPVTLAQGNLLLSELKITPAEIVVGKAININVVATNTGGTAGSFVVSLSIDGASIASQNVNLEVGQSESLTFITSQNTAGSHILKINDLESTIEVKPESQNTGIDLAKLPWLIIGIAALVILGIIAALLFIKRKKGRSAKVQTEQKESVVALNENTSAHTEKQPESTVSLSDDRTEKADPEPNKTPLTENSPEPAKPDILIEQDQKGESAIPDQNETNFTDGQQLIKSNILGELEHNLIIATAPLGDKLIPFDTTYWNNVHLENDHVLLDHQEDIIKVYSDINMANTVVVLANRFEHRSEAVDDSYLKLCVKIAEQIKILVNSQNHV